MEMESSQKTRENPTHIFHAIDVVFLPVTPISLTLPLSFPLNSSRCFSNFNSHACMTLFFRSFVTMDGGDGDNAFEEAVI